jgi:hypothetical protein
VPRVISTHPEEEAMPHIRTTAVPSTVRARLLTAATAVLVVLSGVLAPAAPAAAQGEWQDRATSWTSPGTRPPKIVDLRFAAHRRFDRVVVDVVGAIPAGRAHYARRFHYDGSGALVPIHGRSGLALTLHPAVAHNARGHSVYDGPRIARPHLETLKALAFTGDFEGTVSFGFALTHRAEYRVFFLHDPQRLVIDFRHAAAR